MEFLRVTRKVKKPKAPYFKAAVILIALLVAAISFFLKHRPDLVEKYYSAYVSNFFCSLTSLIMDVFPFSVAEILLIAFVIGTIIWIILFAYRLFKKPDTQGMLLGAFTTLIVVACLFYIDFQVTWGLNYYRYPLSKNLNLDDKTPITAEELAKASEIIIGRINTDISKVSFEDTGFSRNPMTFFETAYKLGQCYDKASRDYPFIGKMFGGEAAKPVMLSKPMTYTFISGVYSVPTGEANVNVNFPDFLIPDTTAHEMAHSRRIAREDEANFIAFLVCSYSDEPYIRYSTNVSALIYLSNALSKTDKKLFDSVFSKLDSRVWKEYQEYNKFLESYKTKTKDIAEKVNDTYLKSHGQTEGVMAYDQMVKWVVAYLVREH